MATAPKVSQDRVASHRLKAMHLVERLPPRSHGLAAFGGLQDSAPRAALFALHARMQQIHPGDWEDPSLVQIWFRMADYVVPRRDVGVFTIGALPRDPERRAALQDLADRVLQVLDGQHRRSREVIAAIPELDSPAMGRLRQLSVTGKLNIRWDARTVTVLPAVRPDVDEEDARRELARRFLHWLGPANPSQLAKWAGIDRSDAEATWRALGRELVPVVTIRGTGMMLAGDQERVSTVRGRAAGARLLPLGDPYLYPHGGLRIAAPPQGLAQRARDLGASDRLVNSLAGRVLLDGAIVCSWGRAGTSLAVMPWRPLSREEHDEIERELEKAAGPLGAAPRVRWLTD
jgi:Winged helix DNA-binding domain